MKPWQTTSYKWATPEGSCYVHIGEKEYGNPRSVWIRANVGAAGTALNAAAEALGVVVARCMRSGVGPEVIYRDLCGITSELYADGGSLVYEAMSIADAIAQTIGVVYGSTFEKVQSRSKEPKVQGVAAQST